MRATGTTRYQTKSLKPLRIKGLQSHLSVIKPMVGKPFIKSQEERIIACRVIDHGIGQSTELFFRRLQSGTILSIVLAHPTLNDARDAHFKRSGNGHNLISERERVRELTCKRNLNHG